MKAVYQTVRHVMYIYTEKSDTKQKDNIFFLIKV